MAKAVLDFVGAAMLLLVLSPLLLLCMLLVKLDRGPIFYTQLRVGRNEKLFMIIKLRTMIVDADHHLDADGKPTLNRVTRIGALLRISSLDELPQLLNILKGEMTFVGPRPILPSMLQYLTARERTRFQLKPGLTGLAQIKGRNKLLWSRRFSYDVVYTKRQTLALDLWIAWLTIRMLLRREGVVIDRNPTKVDDITGRVNQVSTTR